ncbi:MAG TPA: HIT domain-containing protein [Propionibacteriaceae bacterium]|nr:HIT domain-containing protein [Propionibacteriaceae bacterium]
MSVDPDCIFCRIIAGEIGSRQVYEDEHAFAFLDLAPWHRGHTLVVPRQHVVDLLAGEAALTPIAPAVDAVSRLLVDRLGAAGLNVLSSAGAVAGQEVFHLHVHLIPRYADRPGLGALMSRGPTDDSELDAVWHEITGP